MNYLNGPLPDLTVFETVDYTEPQIDHQWDLYREEQKFHAVVAAYLLVAGDVGEATLYAREAVRMSRVVTILTEERHARGVAERIIDELETWLEVPE